MPPSHGQQTTAYNNFRSPFNNEPGSTSSSGFGGAHQSSGYSSNALREASTRPGLNGSTSRPHPEPIRPSSYPKPSAPVSGTGKNGLSHRPSFFGSQSQTSSSQPRSIQPPRLILSPSPEPPSRKSDIRPQKFNSYNRGEGSSTGYGSEGPSKSQNINSGYPQKYNGSSSNHQGNLATSHRKPQSEVPRPVKAPFRASANVAHPSHYQTKYRQSNLQFSTTPNPAPSPRSSFQIVIPTSPAKFYGKSEAATSTLPKKRGRPFSKNVPVEKTPKKRGRPFATVESELRAKARASGTSTPASHTKAGRPRKIRRQVFIPQPEPLFFSFKCEWAGCQAELQNLETLRLHIHLLHKKRVDGKVLCLWGKCTVKQVVEGDNGARKIVHNYPEFKGRGEWKTHLETEHLIPFSWHMGDGPRGTDLTGKAKGIIDRAWLIDENGNQVTPSVEGQAIEEGIARDLNKARFRKMRGVDIFREKAEMKKDLKNMSGGTGMLPPQVSSDDEDEGTGVDEPEAGLEIDGMLARAIEREAVDEEDSEDFGNRGGGSQAVGLDYDEVMDSDEDGRGRDDDMDDEGDVQMVEP
ncbi:hypothetical protein VTL71DRAFT_14257 [Oculimacula yallundae]|uniref:C2H2-type domain-containing protein n=1 Tax=Oculimacula yallundae TaxID=86028 RepID=A0ABR4CK24_9HELO